MSAFGDHVLSQLLSIGPRYCVWVLDPDPTSFFNVELS